MKLKFCTRQDGYEEAVALISFIAAIHPKALGIVAALYTHHGVTTGTTASPPQPTPSAATATAPASSTANQTSGPATARLGSAPPPPPDTSAPSPGSSAPPPPPADPVTPAGVAGAGDFSTNQLASATHAANSVSQHVNSQPNGDPPLVDDRGTAWDPALHSSSKTKNANGTWKKRRGVASQDPPAAPATNGPPPPPADGPAPPPPGDPATGPSGPHVAQTTHSPATPAAPAPASGTPASTVVDVMPHFFAAINKLSGLMEAGKITREGAESLAKSLGAKGLGDLQNGSLERIKQFETLLPA